MGSTKALFIIPMFNEEQRMNTEEYKSTFRDNKDINFLLIDDASYDNTSAIINELTSSYHNVISIKNIRNMGKAASIRTGILNSDLVSYDFIGYLDADLSVPFSEMFRLLEKAAHNKDRPFVMGSRIKLISNNISRSKLRHYLGRIFATIVSQFILKVPVYDTQCGAKIMQSKLAENLFKKPFETKWLFDIELLLRYKKMNIALSSSVLEVPLDIWTEKGHSKIKFYEFISFPFQLIKLHYKYA